MVMKNPQADFEDSIFGPSGMHPTPGALPYPSQPLKTLFGLTTEYLIPEGQKEKVLKKLFPFGNPPPLSAVYMDIHSNKEFRIGDFKVVGQNGYVMPVSPFFAEDGASVVDWQPKGAAEEEVRVEMVSDETSDNAFRAGYADGFTGMPRGAAKPSKTAEIDGTRYGMIETAYEEGYEAGSGEREASRCDFSVIFTSGTNRRIGRRPSR